MNFIQSILKGVFDTFLFLLYSLSLNVKKVKGKHLIFLLRKEFHSVEKGLSLRNSRDSFGAEPRRNVKTLLTKEKKNHKQFNLVASSANESLKQYNNRDFEAKIGGSVNYIFQDIDFHLSENLLTKRRSVRTYNNTKVPIEVLSKITAQAVNAPSVCNRQHWKVLYIQDKKIINNVLKYQNGNRGFTDEIYNLAVVLSDRRAFGFLEKDQIDFDSGLFAMQLINSLTLNGIVSCPLNACLSIKRSLALYKLLKLPKYYKITMFLSFGYPEDSTNVAISKRLNSECYFDLVT